MRTPRSAESKAGDLTVEIHGDDGKAKVRAWNLLEDMTTQLKDRSTHNPFRFSVASRHLDCIITGLRTSEHRFQYRIGNDKRKQLYRDMWRNVEAVLDVVEHKRLAKETRSHRDRDRERKRATRGSESMVDDLAGLRFSLETCLEQADDFEEALSSLTLVDRKSPLYVHQKDD